MEREYEKMTLYYRKSNGSIEEKCTEENDMSFYKDLKDDYELTHDFIVTDFDRYVWDNAKMFKIENKKVVLRDTDTFKKYM